jgi:hypothetical protein
MSSKGDQKTRAGEDNSPEEQEGGEEHVEEMGVAAAAAAAAAPAPDAPEDGLTEYERRRNEIISRNRDKMREVFGDSFRVRVESAKRGQKRRDHQSFCTPPLPFLPPQSPRLFFLF